jgi:chloramphenicol 3-O-phosphotransferase
MKIAVVGTCASGKSTIVAALRDRGHDAYAVSQEHSMVKALWKHLGPEFLVLLEVDYEDVRQRRGGSWPRWLYEQQRERLNDARRHADVVVDTGRSSLEECVSMISAAVGEK